MEILVIGKNEIKEYIKENINTDNDKFLIPKEINGDVLEKILGANRNFDYVVFSLEEVVEIPDVKKHLIALLKRYGTPDKFTIVDKKGRLGNSVVQLSKMASIVAEFDGIQGLPKKEKEIDFSFDSNEKEIDLSELDKLLSTDIEPTPVRETRPVSAVQPEPPAIPENDILNDILKNPSVPTPPAAAPSDDIMAILGIDALASSEKPLPTDTFPGSNIFGADSENTLDKILNGSPEMPILKPNGGSPLQNPVQAQVQPSNNLFGDTKNMILNESDIPESGKPRGGIKNLIDNIIGPGKAGFKQLPAIPQEVMPDNLKRPYIITFWASKGGTGKTTVALNTCAYISSLTDLRVILIDVDEFGDTGLSMGMEKQADKSLPTVDDFINHISSMKTFDDVTPFVLKETSTNLHVLLTSENSSNSQRPTKSDYQNVLRILQQHFDIIAFDCGDKLYDDYTRLALTKADFIIMVVDQGFPTLSHMSQIISEFSQPESGIGRDKLLMVVNKYQKNVGMGIQDINTWFDAGVSTIHWIPAIFYESMKYLNQGDLIILSSNMDIKQAYNRIVCDILRKIKTHQVVNP